jgi:hypothetical protein
LALVVDAKYESLAARYASLGFQPMLDEPLRLFIPNAMIAAYFSNLS